LRFLAPDQLVKIQGRHDRADQAQSIGLGGFVNIIRRDHMPGARHILHDDVRVTGDVLIHMGGENASPLIVQRSSRGTDVHGDGLPLIEIALRERRSSRYRTREQGCQ
jgi:hypothetical protein